MRIDDLVERVQGEPERSVKLRPMGIPLEMRVQMQKQPGSVTLADILAAQKPAAAARECRYRHVLGPPATEAAIAAWQTRRPAQPLPTDLLDLVRRTNGIHLWADSQTGRAHKGLAPVEEWDIARFKMYGPDAPPNPHFDDRYVAISYDVDGGAYVVIDTMSGGYYQVETSGPRASSPIAANVEELLDWLWSQRVLPSERP